MRRNARSDWNLSLTRVCRANYEQANFLRWYLKVREADKAAIAYCYGTGILCQPLFTAKALGTVPRSIATNRFVLG